MQRYMAIIEYDGSNYVGFQVQNNGKSIQAELNKALKSMTKGQDIDVSASGRTDSGVHALGQVIHFDYPLPIPVNNLLKALNSLLPDDIYVKQVTAVSHNFHARYSAKGKRYRYRVDVSDFPDPFKRLYTLHHAYRLDIGAIQEALNDIVGEHDFTSFCSTKTDKTDKVRLVTKAEVAYVAWQNEVHFVFEGTGFLYNMVRILVGTALQIGNGLKPIGEMKRLIEIRDRNQAGPTAPPHGLYMEEVYYEAEDM